MKRSLSLQRILALVFMCVLLSAFVTLGVYSILSPRIFAEAKLRELYPRAEYLAEQASQYFASERNQEFMWLFNLDSRQWGATVYLLDIDRNVVANSDTHTAFSTKSENIAGFESLITRVLEGQELSYVSYLVERTDNTAAVDQLVICIPVLVESQVMGAVILLKPLEEIVSAMSSLSLTLWLSALSVMLAMLPLAYWSSRRITNPLRGMRDVALRMAAGDFDARANDQEKGEIGDLARALNHLSAELGETIQDLTYERNQAVTIINALGEGIMAVDRRCRPTQTNPALQTMMIAAGVGRVQPLPNDVWDDFHTVVRDNRRIDRNFVYGELLVHLTVTPVADPRTGVISAIGVFRDDTQAQRLEQTRRDYVANVSHELRTPLTALRALIEPLRDGLIQTEEKRREIYDIILRETLRLSRLVDDMLELSSLQQGKLALEKVRFKLEPLLHDTASVYAAKAADTGHILVLDIAGSPLPPVLGNPDRIEQVLVALLNNAFTYTPPGSRILLRAEPFGECVEITVEDNGPGIKREDLPNIFERFYKADKSHSGSGGTGLGLAIAREILDKLGESIAVENCETGGARFRFTVHFQ